MKQHKGELWGMSNLFKESLHKVTAQETFANERPDVHYHLRQMDAQDIGKPSPCSAPGLSACRVLSIASRMQRPEDRQATVSYQEASAGPE